MNGATVSSTGDLLVLLAGTFAFLGVATAIAYALRARVAPDRSNPAIENLIARILAWWTMVVFLGLAFLAAGRG